MFKRLHKITRDYFSITNKEASGLLVVFTFILFFTLLPLTFSWFPSNTVNDNLVDDQKKLDSLVSILNQAYREPITKPREEEVFSEIRLIDINTISLNKLLQLKLIDSKIATRLVKFRDKLGGFYSINQLDEVYGLSPDKSVQLRKKVYVKRGAYPDKIQINKATFKKILSHPYLSYDEVKLIFSKFRNKNKTILGIEMLLSEEIIDAEKAIKLKKYLSFN